MILGPIATIDPERLEPRRDVLPVLWRRHDEVPISELTHQAASPTTTRNSPLFDVRTDAAFAEVTAMIRGGSHATYRHSIVFHSVSPTLRYWSVT